MRLLLVVLLVPFHAVLGLALLSADPPVAADWYLGLGRTWGASPLADQLIPGFSLDVGVLFDR